MYSFHAIFGVIFIFEIHHGKKKYKKILDLVEFEPTTPRLDLLGIMSSMLYRLSYLGRRFLLSSVKNFIDNALSLFLLDIPI